METTHCTSIHFLLCAFPILCVSRNHLTIYISPELCSWNNHYCWPGWCGDGIVNKCHCAHGFRLISTDTETTCQCKYKNLVCFSKIHHVKFNSINFDNNALVCVAVVDLEKCRLLNPSSPYPYILCKSSFLSLLTQKVTRQI